MASLLALVVELLTSFVQLLVISVTEVAVRDPLALVSSLVGAAVIAFSVGVFGYLAAGAFVDWLGDLIGTPGQPPQRAR